MLHETFKMKYEEEGEGEGEGYDKNISSTKENTTLEDVRVKINKAINKNDKSDKIDSQDRKSKKLNNESYNSFKMSELLKKKAEQKQTEIIKSEVKNEIRHEFNSSISFKNKSFGNKNTIKDKWVTYKT